jgi:hypothetical protein
MAMLKLSAIQDDRPVKLTIEFPASVHRDLVAYAELLGRETGQTIDPARLVAPMLARFIATDRAFIRARRSPRTENTVPVSPKAGAPLEAGGGD